MSGKRPRLTLATIVRDEERNLPALLASVAGVVDEIVLVDTGSQDDTVGVARRAGCRVVEFPWCDDFAAARNVALEHAQGRWVLVLDADDVLLPAGAQMIRAAVAQDDTRWRTQGVRGFRFRLAELDDLGLTTSVQVSACRLWPHSPRVRYSGRVHESVLRGCLLGLAPGVHIAHSGYAPSRLPAKLARNRRLLEMRLADDPSDAETLFYLAVQAQVEGQRPEAARWSQQVLGTTALAQQLQPDQLGTLRWIAAGAARLLAVA